MDSTVKNWLRNQDIVGMPGIELYLFRPVLMSKRPKEVHLVIVYDKSLVDSWAAITIRKILRNGIYEVTGAPAHILLLSTREIEQTKLLDRIDTERLN